MSAMPDVDPALTAALGYAARGWRVLPIKPGTKRPPMQAWQDHATTDPEIITGWWTGLYKGYGVGIATGKESGVWGLDIDEWEVLVDLEKANTPLPRTFTVTTGSGGSHYYFAYPTDMEITNANQLPRGIDVRGEGGQLVAPPTTHPDTGQVYMQEHSSPSTIAQAPAWLLELVKPPERPEVADRPTTPSPDAGHRPGDIWAAQTSWADILGPDGWTFKYAARDNGGDMWTRPGKEPRQGVSASVGHKGSDVLKVFTSSIEGMGLAEGETYTKIGYLAATRHSGDHSAAAAWLASQGHREDERQVIADMIGDFPEQAPMIELPPLQLDKDGDDDWSPISLADIARAIESGERQREEPSILLVDDHMALLYRARVHSLFGTPGGGKTWVALHAITEQLKAGESCLFIDWEDSADGTVERLLALGCTPEEIGRLVYFSAATALPADLDRILKHADGITLAVLDSAGEAMGAAGIDPNADGPVAAWMARVKSLAIQGSKPAVLLLDHIPKDKEAPSGFAIGSQRKLAAITGASYRLETIVEPARGKPGKLRLIVAKDRLGHRAKGSTAAEVHMEPSGEDSLTIRLGVTEAQAATERGETFRPTVLMERVSRFVEDYPECSTRTIRDEIKGKGEAVKQAIEVLVAEGYITTSPGPRRSIKHVSIRPFTETSDLVDNPPVQGETSSGSPLVPTGSRVVPEPLDSTTPAVVEWFPESEPPTGGGPGNHSDDQPGPVDTQSHWFPPSSGSQQNTSNDTPTRRPLI